MSGYVETTDIDVQIPAEHLQECYNILSARCPDLAPELCTIDDLVDKVDRIFGWMGFEETFDNSEGGFYLGNYYGSSGNELEDFKAIAHLIPEGNYIEWESEGGLYHWLFEGGKLIEQYAIITWE